MERAQAAAEVAAGDDAVECGVGGGGAAGIGEGREADQDVGEHVIASGERLPRRLKLPAHVGLRCAPGPRRQDRGAGSRVGFRLERESTEVGNDQMVNGG